MDTQKQPSYNAAWFPDWMYEDEHLGKACSFWKGVLQFFHDTHSSAAPSYTSIVDAVLSVEPRLVASQSTFERERHYFKEEARKTGNLKLETLIQKPSTLKRTARPPWIDDPSLIERYRPAGVTLPMLVLEDNERPAIVTLGGTELFEDDHGYVRVRHLQRVRDWLDYTHSLAALFIALIMLATWADWLDPDADGMLDTVRIALHGLGFVCRSIWK